MKTTSKIIIGICVLVIGFSLWLVYVTVRPVGNRLQDANSPVPVQKSTKLTQTNNQGNVDVSVTPVVLAAGKPAKFDVEINNHVINLDFDMIKISSLSDDSGRSMGTPTWDGSPPGGHHRGGTLTFSTVPETPKSVTLTIKNVANISERRFTFDVSRE